MIKIRLHGTAAEIMTATKAIKEQFNVFNETEPYADRGKSLYSRVYIDAEPKAPKTPVAVIVAATNKREQLAKIKKALFCCTADTVLASCLNCPYLFAKSEHNCVYELLNETSKFIKEIEL